MLIAGQICGVSALVLLLVAVALRGSVATDAESVGGVFAFFRHGT